VGTEAVALEHLERNRKEFGYPEEGFESRIEYSLLYSMINEPNVYPHDVVKEHIAAEDFSPYLTVAKTSSISTKRNANDINEDERVSYAQLSAILALAADKFPPPPKDNDEEQNQDDGPSPSSNNNSIAQMLGKSVMQCVFRYAQKHNLDRKAEIEELLEPVQRYALKRNNQQSLDMLIPLYVGYAATLITLNPIPVIVGAAVFASKAEEAKERAQNMKSISSEAARKADEETTSLLDEAEEF
jgi:hypothetical protein